MRLHSLDFVGIGPFRDRQSINFDLLGQAGIFLIDGPTGAGKTTIIDAIVFALYGDVSGKEADSSRLRSAYCGPTDSSEVTIEFSVGDRKVWLHRTPRYQRAKKSGAGTTEAAATQVLREFASDGSVKAELTSANEIGVHIAELLGMNAQAFRQLVVLPQGEFAELLRMKPSERFTALGPLLGNSFYKRLQDELEREGIKAKTQRSAAELAVSNAVQQIKGALGELADRGDLQEAVELLNLQQPSGSSLSQAIAMIDQWLVKENKKLKASLSSAKKHATQTQVHAERAGEYQTAVTAIHAATQARAHSLAALDPHTPEMTREQAQEQIGELLQLLTRLEPIAQREENRDSDAAELQALATELSDHHQQLAQLTEFTTTAPIERERLKQSIAALEILSATLTQRESEVLSLQKKATHIEQLQALESDLLQVTAESDAAAALVASTDLELLALRTELDALLLQQLHDRAAFLAADLTANQACPVCGSHDHPKLAAFVGEAVSDEAIEERRERLEVLQSTLAEHKSKSELAKSDEQALVISAAELRGSIDGETTVSVKEALASAQNSVIETENAIAALPGLLDELASIQKQLENNEEFSTIERAAVTKLTTQLEQLEKIQRLQGEADREVLGEAASATALEKLTRKQIEGLTQFRECDEKLALAKASLPALAEELEVDVWLASVISAHEEAMALLEDAEHAAGLVGHAAQLFKNPREQLLASVAEHQELLDRTAPAIALADAVTASKTSMNSRRMTLQSYAVQRRFESVLDAASIHLNRMSGGKYTLELDDLAKGNAQSGLGIKISDAWSGQSRDPRSLSGGETFYAALALALGLADVVRDEAGGTQLETLFVDEGFGSLDQESLQLVLEQLDALRSGGRIVGVVSHVTEMKDWVQDRVEVEVSPDRTSRVRTLL
ncbi:unannotated protein [freshwater metagenome]|uniref:Unannotated protein n=1 Tax=freshwater metagenome TaxID=449393 RepID=A0A6J6LFF1_9ZZZZ|nr:AAA family ATPase [Actinomycetota bacterium]